MRRTRVAILGLLALGQLSLPAWQEAQPPADQRPAVTFKSEINFVEIDAIVTDRQGRFVAGLTKADFEILEEGRRQQIAAFDMVHIPVTPVDPAVIGREPVDADVASNREAFAGRIYLLVLDDLQTDVSRTQFVRRAARDFVERRVAANDLVAIAFTSGRSAGQDFTSSRRRLVAAIETFTGNKLISRTAATLQHFELQRNLPPEFQEPAKDTYEAERALRAKTSLDALKQFSRFLSGIRGRRKTLVYFGEGIDYELRDAIQPDTVTITRDVGGINDGMREVIRAATQGNVSIYTIDPRALSSGVEEAIALPTPPLNPSLAPGAMALVDETSRSHSSMRAMAEQTGGIAFVNTNESSTPLDTIVRDSSSFYILGYYAPAGRKDGRFRRVEVRVTKPGLTVRSRKGYYAPNSTKPLREVTTSPASPELLNALRSPLPVAGLPMSVSAAPFQAQAPHASVALVIELDVRSLTFVQQGDAAGADVELQISAVDPTSKRAHSNTYQMAELRLAPETYRSALEHGIRIIRRLELPPGRYRLQVGARDRTSGAVGTVYDDLDVPDFHKPLLAVSGIVLVSAAATRMPTLEPDPALSVLLPGAHTAVREFPSNDTLAVFAEIYDNDLRTPHRVAVETSITAEDGTVVFSATDQQRSDRLVDESAGEQPVSGGWGHRVTIPVTFSAGRYVLRVEAARLLESEKAVARELEFRIK